MLEHGTKRAGDIDPSKMVRQGLAEWHGAVVGATCLRARRGGGRAEVRAACGDRCTCAARVDCICNVGYCVNQTEFETWTVTKHNTLSMLSLQKQNTRESRVGQLRSTAY